MSTPLLATKLYLPPPRPNAVLRPRLIETLNEGLHRRLTVISAPAGFGKTTLVAEWLAGSVRPAAWLSLDEGDNDLNQFLAYWVAALQTLAQDSGTGIDPDFGQGVLDILDSPPPVPTEPILTGLVNEISEFPKDIFLVFDDYHTIDAEPVHEALTFVLTHAPPQLHLVLATREEPDLPLARLRARDQLTELRAADLRFNLAETAEFLNHVMGLDLQPEEIAALETRTEGWAAGLQLSALSIQAQDVQAGFIQSITGSDRFVLDYLLEEVLAGQPQPVREFLLQTAILDRLCGPLCEAVLDDREVPGQETLEYLQRTNLLLVPLDDRGEWFRYHQLFADVLRAHLKNERPEQLAGLHRRASVWYQQHSFPDEAIHHVLAARDFEPAARMIELAWSAIRRSCFRSPTWLGWVRSLPEDLVRVRPVLSVGYAWELLSFGELQAAEAPIRDAERWLESGNGGAERPLSPPAEMVIVNEAEVPLLPATLANARAYLAQARGDLPGMLDHARRALALVADRDAYTRGIAGSLLGLGSWASGDLETAEESLADSMASLEAAGNILYAISVTPALGDILVALGRLHQAIRLYERSLHLATASRPVLGGTTDLHLGLSELYRERGDAAAAEEHFRKSEALGEGAALPSWSYRVSLAHAQRKQDQGDLEGALELFDQAQQLYERIPVSPARPISALKVRAWTALGRLDEARAWAQDLGLSADDELSYLREFEHATLVKILIAQHREDPASDDLPAAIDLLKRMLEAAETGGRTGSMIEILVLLALAHEAMGDMPQSLGFLASALQLAEPQGYVRIFVAEGAPMARLLSAAAAQGILPAYVGKLRSALGRVVQEAQAQTGAPDDQLLIEPLSDRELEVLALIAQGLSNREIGERLFLALNTVKGHNRNIFGKLGVKRRTEAVARARELGLV